MEEGRGGGREEEREGYGGRGRECVWERERENVCFDT